jgi:UDP-N-acetylmuramoyl-tripeptide--D-alanyl-D-alanine ligase
MLSTLGQVAADVAGALAGADVPVTGVAVDSRQVSPGAVFVAIRGHHVDGHDFAAAAVAAGGAAALAERPLDVPHVLVPDTVAALGRWAMAHRSRLDAHVTGITGSVGKTGTKDLLAALLAESGPTIAPPGSYNNDVGLPLTVLRADEQTRHLVLEMGARAAGDIARLCRIGRPQVGVVLNVGSAHLGEFGSRQAIAAAKGELAEAASDLVVLNADDPYVAGMAGRSSAPVRWFGAGGSVRAEQLALTEGGRPAFVLMADEGRAPVRMRLVGLHQVPNALAAAAVALHLGIGIDDVARVLSTTAPASRWRMEVVERPDGVTIVNDAYNANPDSVRAAIDATLAIATPAGRRSWAVLGAMLELGADSEAEHEAIGAYATTQGIDRVLAVGPEAAAVQRGAGTGAHAARDLDGALALLRREVAVGDVVLIKASRGARLEQLAQALLENAGVDGRERNR